MLTDEDVKKLNEFFVNKHELNTALEDFKQNITKVVNDARDYVVTELKSVKEDSQYNQFEHDEFKKRLQRIESTPAIAHELKSKKG